MKILKRGILIAAALTLLAIVLVSCLSGGKMMSITVTPANSTIATGSTQQYAATAMLSDGQTVNWTSAVIWTSSSTIVDINANGLATSSTTTGVSGTVIITATDPLNNLFSSATLTVADLSSLMVSPASATITPGSAQQFTAIATLSTTPTITQDLTSSPSVSWDSSDKTVATISSTGLATPATPINTSTTTITVKHLVSSLTGTAVLTVQ